ncbi:MAG: hypothetical protein IKV39_02170 [Clostridia bacterium]|nr:hypothetical protein [Clostridia bacterium]
MSIKQLSVFAENKHGSIYEITKILSEAGIDIRAFSVADTHSYGVLRLIVSDTRHAAFSLSSVGKIVDVTDVVAVQISDEKGGLAELLKVVTEQGINIEYLYAFVSTTVGEAYVVIRVSNNQVTEQILRDHGFELLTDEDIKK